LLNLRVKDNTRQGRPARTTTKNIIEKNQDMLNKDTRYTVRDLARLTNFSLSRVNGILKKHLQLRKLNARWITHLVTDEQKRTRVANAKTLLKMYPNYNKKAFNNFVTCVET
jgi:hypothetical protein